MFQSHTSSLLSRRVADARRTTALLAATCALALTGPLTAAHAASSTSSSGPVGGPLLGSRGVVVHSTPGVPPLPKNISASSWLIADMDTGQVLATRDPHGKFLPASTLKTLTGVTLIPKLNPAQIVTATDEALADVPLDSSRVGVVAKQRYHVYQLFEAMLMVSGNDAANTVALAYGGIPKTIAAMNVEAAYLHADDTHAQTTNGLDAKGQYTSAYDLALIGRAGMALPDFRKYVAKKLDYFPAGHGKRFQIFTHNKLLLRYPGAVGIKPGYTVAAQATYVGAATRGGHTIIVTMMHAKPHPWDEAEALLDWGFAARGKAIPVGELVQPGTPTTPAAGASAEHRGSPLVAATHPGTRTASTDTVTVTAAALGALVVGGGALQLRFRSRRRRRRQRYALPRW